MLSPLLHFMPQVIARQVLRRDSRIPGTITPNNAQNNSILCFRSLCILCSGTPQCGSLRDHVQRRPAARESLETPQPQWGMTTTVYKRTPRTKLQSDPSHPNYPRASSGHVMLTLSLRCVAVDFAVCTIDFVGIFRWTPFCANSVIVRSCRISVLSFQVLKPIFWPPANANSPLYLKHAPSSKQFIKTFVHLWPQYTRTWRVSDLVEVGRITHQTPEFLICDIAVHINRGVLEMLSVLRFWN